MIEYGVLLLKPQGDKSITQALNRGDERDKKALSWFLACYEEMKKRNFREKQKIACEAYIGISYFKCQNHKKAYEYFIRNFEYKASKLPNDVLWDYIECGIENLQFLGKKKDLLEFRKARLMSFGSYNEEGALEMMKIFEIDVELHLYQDPEESPYFQDVLKAIKDVDMVQKNCNYLNVKFVMSLLSRNLLTPWIPKLLEAYDFGDEHGYRYQYFHSYMEYCFKIGDYEGCINYAPVAIDQFDLYDEDFDFCKGIWCPVRTLGDAYFANGQSREGFNAYNVAWDHARNSGASQNEEFSIVERLSRQLFLNCDPIKAEKVCQDALKCHDKVTDSKFDPYVRIAQCLRKQGKKAEAKSVMMKDVKVVDANYKSIFLGCLEYELSQDEKKADKQFVRVIKKLEHYNNLKKVLADNSDNLTLFPGDAQFFVKRAYSKSKMFGPTFQNQLLHLYNSMKISSQIKAIF